MLNNFELEHGVSGSLEKNDRIDAGMRVRPFGAYFVFLILISEEKSDQSLIIQKRREWWYFVT